MDNNKPTKDPIKFRKYGRHMQNLIAQISNLKDHQQQIACTKALAAIMMTPKATNKQRSPQESSQLWYDLAEASDHKLPIEVYPSTTAKQTKASI